MNRRLKTALAIDLLVLAGLVGLALADEPSFGRVNHLDGEAYLLREGENDWDFCSPNMMVAEGDVIRTERGSRLEIQFRSGTLFRMGSSSTVTVEELWLDEYDDEEIGVLFVEEGRTLTTVRDLGLRDAYFTLRTSTAALNLEEDARVRLDANRSGLTRVFVYRGSARLRTELEVVYLTEDERVTVDGYGDIVYLDSHSDPDEFDRWCDGWDERYVSVRVEHVPVYYPIGIHDLDPYGRWEYVYPHGWVWMPYVEVGWRPYHHGRWVYRGHWGWVWVAYEPWGWIPYHYGRWTYAVGFGWIWIPGHVWGPGWVAWSYGPGWVCWTPLDPWDYPLYSVYVGIHTVNVWTSTTRASFIRGNVHPKPYKRTRKPPAYEPHPGEPPRKGGWYAEQPGSRLSKFDPPVSTKPMRAPSIAVAHDAERTSEPVGRAAEKTERTVEKRTQGPSTTKSPEPATRTQSPSPTKTSGPATRTQTPSAGESRTRTGGTKSAPRASETPSSSKEKGSPSHLKGYQERTVQPRERTVTPQIEPKKTTRPYGEEVGRGSSPPPARKTGSTDRTARPPERKNRSSSKGWTKGFDTRRPKAR
jgi:hypothetical protein